MRPKIRDTQQLLALPWPDDVPVLGAEDLCPHSEPRPGRKTLWDWIKCAFESSEQSEELRDQFSHVLYTVMQERLDRTDKGRVVFSDVPSPSEPNRHRKIPYPAAEVAGWWQEALRRVGYLIDDN